MIKNFFMKKMLQKHLQGVPQEEQDALFAAIEKNPEFFKQIAREVQQKIGEGEDQMTATMEVLQKHQQELQNLMGK